MLARVVAVVAVHFLEELSRVGLSDLPLLRILVLVVEEQVLESLIASGLTIRIELLQALAELIGEPNIGAAVARRFSRLEVRLQHPLRVRKGAVGFCNLCRRKKEDLGLDVLNLDFAALHFRRGFPEIDGLVLPVVLDDEPLELAHRGAFQLRVERGRRILADAQHPFDLPGIHGDEHREVRVVAEDPGMPSEAEIVLAGRGLAVHRFEVRNDEFRRVRVVTGGNGLRHQVIVERVVLLQRGRRRQVSVNRVVESRNVGGSLDRGVTAERHDAGARPAEISQQKLEQRAAADDLRAIRMLRPRDGIGKRRRSVGAGIREDRVGHVEKCSPRTTGRALDHLRRVTAEVLLDDLEGAPWILQRDITLGWWLQQRLDQSVIRRPPRRRRGLRPFTRREPRHFAVLPTPFVVVTDESVVRPLRYAALVLHQPRKHSVVVLGVLVVRGDDRRCIGVVHHPRAKEGVLVPSFAFKDVTDDAAQKRDIRTGAQGGVDVGDGASASETRIDVNDLGPVLDLGLHGPAEGDGMVLRHVGTHDDHAVGIRHAARVHGGRAAAEPRPQTGDAGAVSNPGLVLDGDDAETTHQLLLNVIPLDIERRAAQRKDGGRRVHDLSVRKSFDEGVIARLLHELGDAVHRSVQVPDFPGGRSGSPMQHAGRSIGIDVQLERCRALRAEGPFVVRAAGVAFDVHNLAVDRIDQRRAAN